MLIKKYLILLLIIAFGFAWYLLPINQQLHNSLPENLANTNTTITGYIASIPELKNNTTEFEYIIIQANNRSLHIRVRLSWRGAPPLKVGDVWQLIVQLKKPRGFWDQNSFDYQQWLFERNIIAVGYVKSGTFLKTNVSSFAVDRIRQQLAISLTSHLHSRPLNGLIAALAVGVRDQITEAQWNVLRGTGTNHLFAIAGLHIGFASGMFYALISFCWRRFGALPLYIATPQTAVLGALFIALIYAALAGFALPTQRAIIMISVFLAATLWRRNLSPWNAWRIALLLILLWDPLTVLSASFWLSFGAVALIIYGMSGRIKKQKWWQHWGRIQWVIAIGLIPLSLLFFQQASLASFIANAIAIPWVGFITLPLSLLGDITWFFSATLSGWLWLGAEYSLQIIWPVLTYIASLNGVQWISYITNYWVLFSSLIAVIIFLAPKRFPARWLGIVWALPLLFWTPSTPKPNECWFTLFDVGQGVTAVIQTAHHTLVYNTGPSFSNSFDAASAVVIPFLQANNIRNIDILFLSSNKNAYTGGVKTLLQQIPVQHVITTTPAIFMPGFASVCTAGNSWQWDNIKFTVLPACILRVNNGSQSILLTSDNTVKDENYLIKNNSNLLPATILIAPHFGSANSSTPEFIQAVHPKYVLFSAAYQNRFGYPDASTIENYKNAEAIVYSTIENGEIKFKLTGNGQVGKPEVYKRHFWD